MRELLQNKTFRIDNFADKKDLNIFNIFKIYLLGGCGGRGQIEEVGMVELHI